eukprot:TRINITY_DN59724_c0_g1_i1.p1 TRINITY_DN59724_c0_g1~~TRINITY_DN59724_c0_g1_i1.p1  ORF type:complete len:432 (-),score=32.25 TRINITY_DN59724_c0_g1_i1:1173-2468(-)
MTLSCLPNSLSNSGGEYGATSHRSGGAPLWEFCSVTARALPITHHFVQFAEERNSKHFPVEWRSTNKDSIKDLLDMLGSSRLLYDTLIDTLCVVYGKNGTPEIPSMAHELLLCFHEAKFYTFISQRACRAASSLNVIIRYSTMDRGSIREISATFKDLPENDQSWLMLALAAAHPHARQAVTRHLFYQCHLKKDKEIENDEVIGVLAKLLALGGSARERAKSIKNPTTAFKAPQLSKDVGKCLAAMCKRFNHDIHNRTLSAAPTPTTSVDEFSLAPHFQHDAKIPMPLKNAVMHPASTQLMLFYFLRRVVERDWGGVKQLSEILCDTKTTTKTAATSSSSWVDDADIWTTALGEVLLHANDFQLTQKVVDQLLANFIHVEHVTTVVQKVVRKHLSKHMDDEELNELSQRLGGIELEVDDDEEEGAEAEGEA